MAITNISIGTWQAGTGALTVPVPASTITDDLLLLFVATSNAPAATPTGFTILTSSPVSTGTLNTALGTRLSVFYAWQTGSITSASLADTGFNNRQAQMMSFRGVDKNTMLDVTPTTSVQATSVTTYSTPTITTVTNTALIVNAMALDQDATIAALAAITSMTNASLSSLTERISQSDATGVGGGLGIITGFKDTLGAVSATTGNNSTTGAKAYMTIALRPAPPKAANGTFSTTNGSSVTATIKKGGQGLASVTNGSSSLITGAMRKNANGSLAVTNASSTLITIRKNAKTLFTTTNGNAASVSAIKKAKGTVSVLSSSSTNISSRKSAIGNLSTSSSSSVVLTVKKNAKGSISVSNTNSVLITGTQSVILQKFGSFSIQASSQTQLTGSKKTSSQINISNTNQALLNGLKNAKGQLVVSAISQVNFENETKKVFIKINGTWREAQSYIKENGQWKQGEACYKTNSIWH